MSAELNLAERALAAAAQHEQQKDQLKDLKTKDREIDGAVNVISALQGEARAKAIADISGDFGELVTDRLSTLLMDEEVRGIYLSNKKGDIAATLEKVKGLQPGKEGKRELNTIIKVAILKGYLEGAILVPNGNPDIGSLRFATVRNKIIGDMLRELRDAAIKFECNSLDSAIQYVKSITKPSELQRVAFEFAENGWIETPLPRNERGKVQFQKFRFPFIANSRIFEKAKELVLTISRQPNAIKGVPRKMPKKK